MRNENQSLSDEKTALMHNHIAHQLGISKREFDEGPDEAKVKIFDEIHIAIDMDNGRLMNFQGSKHVAYAGLAIARDCFTVCMRM